MIKPLQAKPYYNNKFITMDLETRNVNGTLVPYAIALFDGENSKTFYVTDYKDHKAMLIDAIKSIMLRRYHGYKVYLHNFSNFDGIFLFKILVSLADSIQPIINDNRYVNTKFKFNDNKYKLEFRDSLLMLPVSLRKLAKAFDVEDKTIFPYNFISEDTIFNHYAGEVPNYKYFVNITEEEYNQYAQDFKDKPWNLRSETLKYCVQDCVTLYQVLDKFFKQNFLIIGVNASDYVSLPSLNYANFRTRFLNDFEIPVITGEMYDFIKDSYYGGAVDVYRPYGRNVYRYDVNSLYPYIMRNYPMPVGQPTVVDGDSSHIETIIKDETKFSFVEVDIECPDKIYAPLILTKFKFNGVEKTIAPVGKWRGVYTSIEILRGLELGYKFKYYKCVYFTAKIIFKDFVDFYYDIKKNSPKTSSEYTISKLMLNSLYGRFGMSPYLDKHIVANENESIKLSETFTITDVIPLGNGKELISYNGDLDYESDFNGSISSSVPIAAAITAGARVYMSYFKNMNNVKIYYSDTDSIDLDRPLDPKYVGEELGQLKLEHIFDEVVYLAPKIYGGKTSTYEYIKVKGLKNPISFADLKSLLNKDIKIESQNQKWYKNLSQGQILIKDEVYTLSITEGKRELIYNKNGRFIATKPIKL